VLVVRGVLRVSHGRPAIFWLHAMAFTAQGALARQQKARQLKNCESSQLSWPAALCWRAFHIFRGNDSALSA
jgi:hypothetical protein